MAKNVYFAFHYQDVIDFRANVVRNHKLTKGVEAAGYYDHSIWEEAKKEDLAVERLINAELENTTVTAILIGSETYARPWVRYEVFKSVIRGNKLLGIHINSIPGKDTKTKVLGPAPFDHLGIYVSPDGKSGSPTVWDGKQWVYYSQIGTYTFGAEQPSGNRGKTVQLSHWYQTYDWSRMTVSIISTHGLNRV